MDNIDKQVAERAIERLVSDDPDAQELNVIYQMAVHAAIVTKQEYDKIKKE